MTDTPTARLAAILAEWHSCESSLEAAWLIAHGVTVPDGGGEVDFETVRTKVREQFDREAPDLARLAGLGRPAVLSVEDVRHWIGNAVAVAFKLRAAYAIDGVAPRATTEDGIFTIPAASWDALRGAIESLVKALPDNIIVTVPEVRVLDETLTALVDSLRAARAGEQAP